MKKSNYNHLLRAIKSGKYHALRSGKVYSVGFRQNKKQKTWLSLYKTRLGYQRIWLQVGTGVSRAFFAHHFIWIYFNKSFNPRLTINHKNFNRTDNRLRNLEMVSQSKNLTHSSRQKRHPKTKLAKKDVLEIRWLLYIGVTQRLIAEIYGVDGSSVYRCGSKENFKWVK